MEHRADNYFTFVYLLGKAAAKYGKTCETLQEKNTKAVQLTANFAVTGV